MELKKEQQLPATAFSNALKAAVPPEMLASFVEKFGKERGNAFL